jgi:hypothetical protein
MQALHFLYFGLGMLLGVNPLLYRRLKAAGIIHPIWTAKYAAMHRVPLGLLCAIEMMESSGGVNEFGHDPTIFAGAGAVTKAKYLAYRVMRDQSGECQGVGPMQLTSAGLQAEADSLGGCWLPKWNIAVGAHYLGECLRANPTLELGAAAYNGSGPAAIAYGERAVALADHFARVIVP